jgi:hypothetical protein
MKIIFAIFALFSTVALAQPERFESLEQVPAGAKLVFKTSSGALFRAPQLQDQVGFQDPRISPDGQYAGWLALFPNCCTSYPIPLTLVVLDLRGRLYEFNGIQLATFRWCFLRDSASVAFMQTQVHGTNFEHFERRAIRNGRLISQYEYPHEEPENAQARKQAPDWVKCTFP